MKTRKEQDSLGPVDVPAESYGGSFSVRAKKNFQISTLRAPYSFKIALATIKSSAAEVNADLGLLPQKHAQAIQKAAEEFMKGKFDEDFDLDVYQAGAGTPYNMNLNEILANRANELLGGRKGAYRPVHPNDHVNMAQSSNDVIPTALRLAALMDLTEFIRVAELLKKAFQKKAKEFSQVHKVARTHLQDAVPITLGQEFEAYASSISTCLKSIKQAEEDLSILGLGATAAGTGLNAHPKFGLKMCQVLNKKFTRKFSLGNLLENNQSMAVFLKLSSALRGLALELLRMAKDLRLLASGPDAGLRELWLPPVEPGSSIMPGKVNPSIPEALSMICIQVIGLDQSLAFAAQAGELELNWTTPIITWDLLHQIEILTKGMEMFRADCVEGIRAHATHMQAVLDQSSAQATALTPKLGYARVARMLKKALTSPSRFL